MGKYLITNADKKNRKNDDDYWKTAIAQAMASGGSIVVFLPEEKKLLVE